MEPVVESLTPLQTAFQVASGVIFVYCLLIALRIILTWFRGTSFGKPWEYLCRITDPYLNLFRGISFLRKGMFDFTPLAAILVLVIVQNILIELSNLTISFSNVLAIIIISVWRSGVWIAIFFAVLCAIRTIGLVFSRNQESVIWKTMDIMIQPLTGSVSRILRRELEYIQALLITLAALLVFWLVGSLIVGQIFNLLIRVQF